MNPRGIAIAQIDADTELDSKFQKLARQLPPADYYAAFGAYMSIVLRAWGTASRVTDPDLLDLVPPEAVAALIRVGLLDSSGSIPEDVFSRRVGVVLEARRKDADRKRTQRESVGLQRSPTESNESSSPLLSSGVIEKNDGVVEGEGVQGEGDDPVQTYWTLTTRMPRGNALDWCKRLGDEYGFAATSASMIAAWREQDDIRSLLSRTEDALVASARAAELREKAQEKERLREKRARVHLPPVVEPDPTKVAAVMAEIKETLHRGARE